MRVDIISKIMYNRNCWKENKLKLQGIKYITQNLRKEILKENIRGCVV